MQYWIYHPIQKPRLVDETEYSVYTQNGWFKNYSDIPGYVPDENGENTNDDDGYFAQFEEEKPKRKGRPPKSKITEEIQEDLI